jgi:nicotinic acid phosphoribosyltransferase
MGELKWENSTGMVTPAFLLDFGARAAHASENRVCIRDAAKALSVATTTTLAAHDGAAAEPGRGQHVAAECRSTGRAHAPESD